MATAISFHMPAGSIIQSAVFCFLRDGMAWGGLCPVSARELLPEAMGSPAASGRPNLEASDDGSP